MQPLTAPLRVVSHNRPVRCLVSRAVACAPEPLDKPAEGDLLVRRTQPVADASICRQRSNAVSDIRQLPESQAASVTKTLLRAIVREPS